MENLEELKKQNKALAKRVEDLLEDNNEILGALAGSECALHETSIRLSIYETLVKIYRKKSEFELNNLFEDFFLLVDDVSVMDEIFTVTELPVNKKLEPQDETYESFRSVLCEDTSTSLGDTGDYNSSGIFYARLDITEELWLVIPFQE